MGAREAHKEFKNARKMIVTIFKIVRFFVVVLSDTMEQASELRDIDDDKCDKYK